MHPECIGRGHRMAMLERFIDAAVALDGVVFERLDAVRQSLGGGSLLTIAVARARTRLEHRRRQPAGERVLLARVVRAEERVRPDARLRAVPEPRPRPRTSWPSAASARSAASQPNAPSATTTRTLGQQRELAHQERRAGVALLDASACWPAARSGRRPRCRRRSASGRRRRAATSAGWRGPRRGAPRHRKSPDASPVKTRPVRLPPWAAGASPTSRIRASGSPKPGHRPAPVRLVAEPGDLLARDPLAPRDQPRAAPAVDDLRGQRGRAPPGRVTARRPPPT